MRFRMRPRRASHYQSVFLKSAARWPLDEMNLSVVADVVKKTFKLFCLTVPIHWFTFVTSNHGADNKVNRHASR